VLPRAERDHGVAGLVHGDGVPLALDVLDVLGRAQVLELLGVITSFHVMISRPSRMEMISASLTRSLIVAPVA
jgi:hypothetical protein